MLVEDVLDTGRTLRAACDLLAGKGAADVFTCVLIDKPSRHLVEVTPDFLGFTVGEIPIIFANRERGASKISQREIYKAMYTVLRLSLSRLKSKPRIEISTLPRVSGQSGPAGQLAEEPPPS